jgi:hypothetical protein
MTNINVKLSDETIASLKQIVKDHDCKDYREAIENLVIIYIEWRENRLPSYESLFGATKPVVTSDDKSEDVEP